MKEKLKNHIDESLPFLQGKKLLIACSGGVDSIVLTHLMHQLKFEIGLAHCNFSLRGKESDGDEDFVIDLAEKLSIPVFTETFNTKAYSKEHKVSTQIAARELRYTWFDEILKDFKYDYLLTAHHADDALETMLINLSRGTGLRGLTGIPEKNGKIVRPLLNFSREDILNFAKEHKLFWREDSSNLSNDYFRNKLRHDVIPKLKETNDTLLQNVLKTQRHLQESEALIEDYMALVYNLAVTENLDGYTIHLQKLQELPNTNALLYELLHPFGFTAWGDISELISAQSGKQIFSNSHRLLKDRNVFILTKIPSEEDNSKFFIHKNELKIEKPIHLELNPIEKVGYVDRSVIYVDEAIIQFPLQLRKWWKGDVFQPFGMQGKKKLSKFFKDEKLSLAVKEKIWLLCSGETIVWVVNHRADDRFKVTNKTNKILKIKYFPNR